MAKGALTVVNQVNDIKVIKSKKRLTKAAAKIDMTEKENVPALRRSKRKVTMSLDAKFNTDSLPTKSKTRKPITGNLQSHKVKSKAASNCIKESPNEVLSNLNSSPVKPVTTEQDASGPTDLIENTLISSSGLGEDSGFESSTRVSDQSVAQIQSVAYSPVTKCAATLNDEASILTCETSPLNYWMDLAEQKRIALELALQENESLHEQLEVLEAENSHLKQLVKEAEVLSEIVKASLEI